MDPNLIFTFGIPAAVIGSMVWRRLRPADAKETETIPFPETSADGETQKLTLAAVLNYLSKSIDEAPHVFVVGGTGAGKSTFVRLLIAERAGNKEQFVILTGKRSAVFADLPCIGRDPLGEDGVTRFDAVADTCKALMSEIARRDNTPFEQRTFSVLNIIIDDASIIFGECEAAVQLVRTAALIGREVRVRLIILLGSVLVKELGMEGRGDLREHFAVVTYDKRLDQTRKTRLRPRYSEPDEREFDASQVPVISNRARIATQFAWRAPRAPMTELAELYGLPEVEPGRQAGRQAGVPEMGKNGNHIGACLLELGELDGDDLRRAVIETLLDRGARQDQVKGLLRGDTTRTSALIREVVEGEGVRR